MSEKPTCGDCGSEELVYERKGFSTARLVAHGPVLADQWAVSFNADDGPGYVRCEICGWESEENENAEHPIVKEAFQVNRDYRVRVVR